VRKLLLYSRLLQITKPVCTGLVNFIEIAFQQGQWQLKLIRLK